jgi:drug/metabolite transporter (DMT)-like permease
MERAGHAFGAIDVALGRVAGGAAVLAAMWWFGGRGYRVSGRDVWNIFVAALVGLAMPLVILSYCVVQGHGHSYFGMMVAFVPLATIVVSIPMLGLRPTARQLLGVLGGLACILLLIQAGNERGMSLGLVGLALLAPIGYAVGNTWIRWKLSHIPSVPLTMLLLGAGVGLLLPLEFLPSLVGRMHLSRPAQPHDLPMAIAALGFLGVVSTGIAIWLFNRLILRHGPLFAGMVTYVFPLFALAWGQFDGEPLSLRQITAMAGVLLMVALVQFGAARPANGAEGGAPAVVGGAEFCSAQPAEALLESRGEPK